MADFLSETRRENLRLQEVIRGLEAQHVVNEAVRYLTLDELDPFKTGEPADEVTEELIDALRDACSFAAHQVNNAPPGSVLKCIGRWRYAIDRVRKRYIGAGPVKQG